MTKLRSCLKYVFITLLALISIFPLVWMIIASTNSSIEIIRGTLKPGGYLLKNFEELNKVMDVAGGMFNSFRNALLLTTLSIFINSLAGYGFEIYHDKIKDRIMSILLLTMMVPFVAVLIPLFTMFSNWKMINSLGALIWPSMAYPMLIMMFRQASRSFPVQMMEAARIDGLSEIGIFFRMYMPTMSSTFAAAFTISFMGSWNSYLWPLVIFQKKELKTMPLLISSLQGTYSTDYGVLMLAVTLCTLPTVLIFLLLQKNFTEGLVGTVKS